MKIIRYRDRNGVVHYGEMRQEKSFRIEGDLFAAHQVTGEPADVAALLAPVAPTNIYCIGLNYRDHARETGAPIPSFPVLFMKGTGTVQAPGGPIELPTRLLSERVDYEAELAVVIGKGGKNIPREKALDHVLGYTCANDVSARDWQKEYGGSQWCRGKGFDTFCPLGPVLVTPDSLPDPSGHGLHIGIRVNEEVLQDGNTSDMIFDIPALIAFLSGSTTLVPGTVILTGTPHGVGMARKPPRWLQPGDRVTVEIEGIGQLSNPVVREI